MEQRTERAYRLIWATQHLEFCDQEYEIEIRESPELEWTASLMETTPSSLPDPVVFYTDPDFSLYTDYPTNNVYWPVMSRRMYYTLLTVGDFPHRVIPIATMDGSKFTFEPERRFLASGQPNSDITHFDDFVAVQLLEHSNYFNFEHSEYEASPKYPDLVRSVDKYVLNEPSTGFPPLFRLSASAATLFISAKAREVLQDAGIRGTAYYPLDRLQSEVDIPVQLPTYS
jgi:hypothetical protein